jgi:hypothetical protein
MRLSTSTNAQSVRAGLLTLLWLRLRLLGARKRLEWLHGQRHGQDAHAPKNLHKPKGDWRR